MTDHTRGKGPFAKRQRVAPPDVQAPRWLAPRVELTEENIRTFLEFVRQRCDEGVFNMFGTLASMSQGRRLARNIAKLLACMASHDVVDVLSQGLTAPENDALHQLESSAISIRLLGVAHTLMDIRQRQSLVPRLDEMMDEARSSPLPITPTAVKRIERGIV